MARQRLGASLPRIFEKRERKTSTPPRVPSRQAIERLKFAADRVCLQVFERPKCLLEASSVGFGMSLPRRTDTTATNRQRPGRTGVSARGDELDRRKNQEPDITRANLGTGLHSVRSEASFRSTRCCSAGYTMSRGGTP
jgi:hypothetical protein